MIASFLKQKSQVTIKGNLTLMVKSLHYTHFSKDGLLITEKYYSDFQIQESFRE
jgi:hypothetical protein